MFWFLHLLDGIGFASGTIMKKVGTVYVDKWYFTGFMGSQIYGYWATIEMDALIVYWVSRTSLQPLQRNLYNVAL